MTPDPRDPRAVVGLAAVVNSVAVPTSRAPAGVAAEVTAVVARAAPNRAQGTPGPKRPHRRQDKPTHPPRHASHRATAPLPPDACPPPPAAPATACVKRAPISLQVADAGVAAETVAAGVNARAAAGAASHAAAVTDRSTPTPVGVLNERQS